MKIINTMCHSHLLSMLLTPEKFQAAVVSYKASAPDVTNEGMSGYMETTVEFEVRDLERFSKLFQQSKTYPSDRSKWYHTIRKGIMSCE